jgi:hypothetical protein
MRAVQSEGRLLPLTLGDAEAGPWPPGPLCGRYGGQGVSEYLAF